MPNGSRCARTRVTLQRPGCGGTQVTVTTTVAPAGSAMGRGSSCRPASADANEQPTSGRGVRRMPPLTRVQGELPVLRSENLAITCAG